MFLLLFVSLVLKLTATVGVNVTTQETTPVKHSKNDAHKIFHSTHLAKSSNTSHIFVEKPDNVLLLSEVDSKKQLSEFLKTKRKFKKSPRRTVQKIIKKVRKAKKALNQLTSTPTTEMSYEEEQQKQDEIATTQAAPKKKTKKWKGKMARYRMPFQKLQSFRRDTSNTHHRFRRDVDPQRKLYILQDLDEIRFVGNKNGNTAIVAHVKKYW